MAETKQELTPSGMVKVLDWLYDKAVNGVSGTKTAESLAQDFSRGSASMDEKIENLIKWQKTKAATTGFATGLGGLITLPVTIPADLASSLFIQIRMVAAIALMRGYDLKDDRVRTIVFVCIVSDSIKDVCEQLGIKIGEKLLSRAIEKIPGKVLLKINQKVGFRLLTKGGEKGVVNLSKAVPVVGGVVNASLNYFETRHVAKIAKEAFTEIV